jgi:hypothetical protein
MVTVRVDNDAPRIGVSQLRSTPFKDEDGGRDVARFERRLVTAPRKFVAEQFEMWGGV